MDKFQYRQISIKSPLSHYVVARYYSCCSERKQQGKYTLRAGKLPGNEQCLRENYREISFLIHGCYCGNYDINIFIPYCLSNSGDLSVIYPCFSADIALFSADIALFWR